LTAIEIAANEPVHTPDGNLEFACQIDSPLTSHLPGVDFSIALFFFWYHITHWCICLDHAAIEL
jgi:hypothetical protein